MKKHIDFLRGLALISEDSYCKNKWTEIADAIQELQKENHDLKQMIDAHVLGKEPEK